MLLEELWAGHAEQQQRKALGPIGQVLDEGEQGCIRPVQILEHERSRVIRGERLAEAAPGGERLLARGGLAARTHQRRQAGPEPGAVRVVCGQGPIELSTGLLGRVGFEDPALGLDDLPECPEGDALSVGQATALAPPDKAGAILDVVEELRTEPALAHAGLADDRHELAGTLLSCPLERPN